MTSKPSKFIIVPGNGCTPVEDCNWYLSVADELKKLGFKVMLKDMPDPYGARESKWIPFIQKDLECDSQSIIIGHSSGAEAAMRLAEQQKVLGLILVSACHTDLGLKSERLSGYYSREWKWDQIKKNTNWIIQLHSKDDHLVPIEEGNFVAKSLGSEYHVFEEEGHFLTDEFPQLIEIIKKKLNLK